MSFRFFKEEPVPENHWLSTSDLMAGLMMVFLLIAVSLMRHNQKKIDIIEKIVIAYDDNQNQIYKALMNEFKNDLKKWDASIEKQSLTFTFQSPDVLFAQGSPALQPKYKEILSDFFPRYLKVIAQFKPSIEEIRLEGHTSSEWRIHTPTDIAYFNNMALSQERTRSVLTYVYNLNDIQVEQPWIKKHMAAVGYSSSHLILDQDKKEDMIRSKRVSFRILTNANQQIQTILAVQ